MRQSVSVRLEKAEIGRIKKLGDGHVADGIRKALAERNVLEPQLRNAERRAAAEKSRGDGLAKQLTDERTAKRKAFVRGFVVAVVAYSAVLFVLDRIY